MSSENSAGDLPTSEAQWRSRLTRAEYHVLREGGTEAPWSGEYVNSHEDGVYRCRACDAELFLSTTKFDSHCGWPSFDQAVPGAIRYLEDHSHGMVRTEVRCARCDSHLGHLFEGEGLTPLDRRYCINSVSMRLDTDGADGAPTNPASGPATASGPS